MGEQQIINDILEELYGYGIHSDSDPEVKKEKEEKYNELVKQINTICTFVEKELKNVLGKDIGNLRSGIRTQVLRSIEAEIANGNSIMDSNGKIKSGKIFDIVKQSKEEVLEKAPQNMSDEKRKNDIFTNDSENYNKEEKGYKNIIEELEGYGIGFSEEEKNEISIAMQRVETFFKNVDEKIASGLSEDEAISLEIENMSPEEYEALIDQMRTVGQIKSLKLLKKIEKIINTEDGPVETKKPDENDEAKEDKIAKNIRKKFFSEIENDEREIERLGVVIKKVGNIRKAKPGYVLVNGAKPHATRYRPVPTPSKDKEEGVTEEGKKEAYIDGSSKTDILFHQIKYGPIVQGKIMEQINRSLDAINNGTNNIINLGSQMHFDESEGQTDSTFIHNDMGRIVGLIQDFTQTSSYTQISSYEDSIKTVTHGSGVENEDSQTSSSIVVESETDSDIIEEEESEEPKSVRGKEKTTINEEEEDRLPEIPGFIEEESKTDGDVPEEHKSIKTEENPIMDKEFDAAYESTKDAVRVCENRPVLPKLEDVVVVNATKDAMQGQIGMERKKEDKIVPLGSTQYSMFKDKEGLYLERLKAIYGKRGSLKETEESANTVGSLNGTKEERTDGDKTPATPSDEEKE